MSKDYRNYLRAAGIKPLRGKLRTEKLAGSVEIVWDPQSRTYVKHVHQGEPAKVVPLKRRAA